MEKESSRDLLLYSLGFVKRMNENFLSDVLRAFCLYNDDLLNKFFHFCFPEEVDCKVYSMDREVYEKCIGRNDFKIYTDKEDFIVESKILDVNFDKSNTYRKKFSKLTYIVSKKNSLYQQGKILLPNNVNCVFWEDFIDSCDNEDFAMIASSVLNYNDFSHLKKPKLSEIESEKNLCDKFFKETLCSKYYDKKGGEEGEWNDIDGYAYGYTIWGSVWFGLLWSPLKGVFWGFGYGKGGDSIINDKIYNFKYIKPLGKYFNDGYFYYEVLSENGKINFECLDFALKEFAKLILVIDENKNVVPLLDFIKR